VPGACFACPFQRLAAQRLGLAGTLTGPFPGRSLLTRVGAECFSSAIWAGGPATATDLAWAGCLRQALMGFLGGSPKQPGTACPGRAGRPARVLRNVPIWFVGATAGFAQRSSGRQLAGLSLPAAA